MELFNKLTNQVCYVNMCIQLPATHDYAWYYLVGGYYDSTNITIHFKYTRHNTSYIHRLCMSMYEYVYKYKCWYRYRYWYLSTSSTSSS